MMRLPFLGTYLFNWHDHERKAVELLEQNLPLQKILMMNYVWGVELFLDADSLKNLKWLQMPDVEKFRRLMEASSMMRKIYRNSGRSGWKTGPDNMMSNGG